MVEAVVSKPKETQVIRLFPGENETAEDLLGELSSLLNKLVTGIDEIFSTGVQLLSQRNCAKIWITFNSGTRPGDAEASAGILFFAMASLFNEKAQRIKVLGRA